MTQPVELGNLRSMTDGDKEMEKILFEEFFSSFSTGVARLSENKEQSAAESWKKTAHALKGMSFNLGAMALGELCSKAETNFLAPPEAKEELLRAIHAEFDRARQFLITLMD